jgi:DNA-binding MarR family transcriptional regulator
MRHHDILQTLLVSTHRLGRMAARSTGNPTWSATWAALSVLETEGPHRIGELAAAVRVSQPGMTKIVQNLVVDEWVLRIADADDSRAWSIAIAPKGAAALQQWRETIAAAIAPAFEDLSPDDWRALERAARVLSSRIERAEVAA